MVVKMILHERKLLLESFYKVLRSEQCSVLSFSYGIYFPSKNKLTFDLSSIVMELVTKSAIASVVFLPLMNLVVKIQHLL